MLKRITDPSLATADSPQHIVPARTQAEGNVHAPPVDYNCIIRTRDPIAIARAGIRLVRINIISRMD